MSSSHASSSLNRPAAANPGDVVGSFGREAFEVALKTWASAPAWWLERKREAFERFRTLPMPKRNDEAWRFSGVSTLSLQAGTEGSEALASRPPAPAGDAGQPKSGTWGFAPAASLEFNDGVLAALAAPSAALAAEGVVVTTISRALVSHGDILREHFMAQAQKLGSEKFAAMHTAFVGDGAFIYLPKGVVVTEPITVIQRAAGGAAVFPHTLVVAGENARATVVEAFRASADTAGSPALVVGANDLYAGHGSKITYVGVQDWPVTTLAIQLNSIVVRRDAAVQSLNLHLGGKQARHESHSQLQAPGAFSEMLALTLASREQEFDQRTLQIHQAPNTRSDLLYKNALRDRARTIFSGLIIVDADAQKTDAYQSNRNLMLSDDAEANSLPGLEIQANDVRCTHGATSARIDAEQEFYLRSRGIPREAADELLVFGFFEDALNRLESEPLRAELRTLIQSKFRRPAAVRA